MDEDKISSILIQASIAVAAAIGDDIDKLGFMLVIRTRDAGKGWLTISSDVTDLSVVAEALQHAAHVAKHEPDRLYRHKQTIN